MPSPKDSQAPKMRTFAEEERLLTVQSDRVFAGTPVGVKVRFSTALKSELARPIKLPVDKRYKRKAFLVALDAELLRRVGQGNCINAAEAAKFKSIAREC